MTNIDWDPVLGRVSAARAVFHAKADFQHAVAWAVHELHPDAGIRLDVAAPLPELSTRARVDLVVHTNTGPVAAEVKYLTRALTTTVAGEAFAVRTHGAQDQRSFDICLDIVRVERLVAARWATSGAVIVVTNDPWYWSTSSTGTRAGASQFRPADGTTLTGELLWGPTAGPGTRAHRDFPLQLSGAYPVRWRHFSTVPASRYGLFRALVVPVTGHP